MNIITSRGKLVTKILDKSKQKVFTSKKSNETYSMKFSLKGKFQKGKEIVDNNLNTAENDRIFFFGRVKDSRKRWKCCLLAFSAFIIFHVSIFRNVMDKKM